MNTRRIAYVLPLVAGIVWAGACGGDDVVSTTDNDAGTDSGTDSGGTTPADIRRSAIDVETTTAEDTPVNVELRTTAGTKTATYKIVADPAHGTLSNFDAANGKVTYTPSPDYFGVDYFRFSTTDDQGEGPTGTAFVTVTPVNDIPVGSAATVTAYASAPVPIDLKATDVDDPDPNTHSFAIATQPGMGTATITGNRVLYTANPTATGTDSFTFTASDGKDTSAPTTVNVDIVMAHHCLELRRAGVSQNGVYRIDADGAGSEVPFDAYCDMSSHGGGWTLALKINPDNATFEYASASWTNNTPVNETMADLDENEAKLRSFDLLSVGEIMVGMKKPNAPIDGGADAGDAGMTMETWNTLSMEVGAPSLVSVFSSGHIPTNFGRGRWKALVEDSSLQLNCNREGINVESDNANHPKVRFGILGNNENDCSSVDSFLGIGRDNRNIPCNGAVSGYMAGNFASCGSTQDNGPQMLSRFAAVFVRDRSSGDYTSFPAEASCKAHLAKGRMYSGTYNIMNAVGVADAGDAGATLQVYCDMATDGGGWMLGYVKNSVVNANVGYFGSGTTNVGALASHPAVTSVGGAAALYGWMDLNTTAYDELKVASYYRGTPTFRSESIAKSDLRIQFGQDGYFLYGDKNGYYWCGGIDAYTDNGSGQVNTPPSAPADCKGHSGLNDGWDFSKSPLANQGLTNGGAGVWMHSAWNSYVVTAGVAGGAQAIWVR